MKSHKYSSSQPARAAESSRLLLRIIIISVTAMSVLSLHLSLKAPAAQASPQPAATSGAQAPTCVAPLPLLVAWYPGEDPANSNIGCVGAGCVPEIKGANTGTGRANIAYASGKVGQAFQFSTNNGSASTQVNVPDSPSLRLTNGLTIEAWVNPTAPGVADNPILVKGNLSSGGSQPYSILFVNAGAGDNRIIFRVGNTSTFDSAVSNSNIPLNVYTHIAATYDGTTMKLFVNGVLDGSTTTSIGTLNQNSLPLTIGGGAGGGSADFAGAVDELKIYSRALSQPEIQGIVDAGSAGTCRTGSNFSALPTYDAASDFSVWSNASKLNGGVWSYGSAASLGAVFAPYVNVQTSAGGGTFGDGYIDAWDAANNSGAGVFHNSSGATQVYSGTVIQTPFELVLQPGSYSFVRWTAPASGQYQLDTTFSARDVTPTTVDVYIIKNYGTASQHTYFSGFIQTNSGTLAFNANFPTNPGDTVDFVVGPGTAGSPGGTNPANDSTGLTATITKLSNTPTAATSSINGRVAISDGTPVSGTTVSLSGSQSRRTITDSNGNYHFENVETSGFYTVTPSRANYNFSPANRSFSILGNTTEAVFTAVADQAESTNPLDTPEFFVRQQYLDFLSREPDSGGFDYWTNALKDCVADSSCLHTQRVDVSNAFFYEPEFQESGAFVYRIYQAASGQRPAFAQFQPDRALVVGGATLDQSKSAFALAFVQRDSFRQKYSIDQTGDEFVATLLNTIKQTSGVDLTSQRAALTALYDGTDRGRAMILRQLADNQSFIDAEYNSSFVLSQYFGYLRRDPDSSGFNFWLQQVNSAPLRDLAKQHTMVCSFITSTEYQQRFSRVVTHSNSECQ